MAIYLLNLNSILCLASVISQIENEINMRGSFECTTRYLKDAHIGKINKNVI